MEPFLGLVNGEIGEEEGKLNALKGYISMKKDDDHLELGLGLSLGRASDAREKGASENDLVNGFCGVFTGGTKRDRYAAAAADSDAEAAGVITSTGNFSQVIGWPPVRAYRMNTLFNQGKNSSTDDREKGVDENEKNENAKKKIYQGRNMNNCTAKDRNKLGFVKVNMDGLQIGRKVDLNAHKSYETLAETLECMFFKTSLTNLASACGGKEQSAQPAKLLDAASEFVLTYEDKEGDWMLVGDVPWGMFLSAVKRLRIMKPSETTGFGQKLQLQNENKKRRPI